MTNIISNRIHLYFALSTESPLQRSIQVQRDDKRVEDLNNQIEQLKWKNANLVTECETLGLNLKDLESTQKTSKNDKWRNTALKEEVKTLKKRIKELENQSSLHGSMRNPKLAYAVPMPSEQSAASSKGNMSTMTKYTF